MLNARKLNIIDVEQIKFFCTFNKNLLNFKIILVGKKRGKTPFKLLY